MKKFLLTAFSVCTMVSAVAGISGDYTVKSYKMTIIGDNYKFADGEEYYGETTEDGWTVTITENEGNVQFLNLLSWGDEDNPADEISAVYEDGVIKIAGGTVVAEEYGILGGLGKSTLTAKALMETCDQYNSYVPDWTKQDVTFTVDGNTIVCNTPILVYTIYEAAGYIGYAYEVFSELVLEKDADASAIFSLVSAEGIDLDENWKFTDTWTAEGEDAWDITITPGIIDEFTITNLLSWDEVVNATYDTESKIITIPAAQTIYVEDNIVYKICGGMKGCTTVENILATFDTYYGYLPASWDLLDIKMKYEDNKISLVTPIIVYVADSSYEGYIGYGYEIIKSMIFESEVTGIQSVEASDVNAPTEYYNLQGVRITNPAVGQIVIMRHGNQVQKIIVR